MAQGSSWIAIVDDDPSVLKSLSRALRVRAFETKAYTSARQFLAALPEGTPACLLLDVQMPGMTGLELHHQLVGAGIHIPTIVITAHGALRTRDVGDATDIVAALFDAIAAAFGRGERA